MFGSQAANQRLLTGLQEMVDSAHWSAVDVLLLPPAPYLAQVVAAAKPDTWQTGAQNVHTEASGAYTGEVAAEMVRDLGASHVLVGHSERRQYFGEDDALLAAKFQAAQRAGLIPVLCVGETEAQREQGTTAALNVVVAQVAAVVEVVGLAAMHDAVIAYEPVWAIGTGRTASPDDAQQVHAALRAWLADREPALASRCQLLYGGSVKADSAAGLFAQPDIDGALVGGASLDAAQFAAIIAAAAEAE